MANNRRKSAAIALAVVGIAGLSLASAATLNLTSDNLSAGTTVVASCQPVGVGNEIAVGYTSAFTSGASATTGRYDVSGVTLKNVNAACAGKAVQVTIVDAAGGVLAELSGTAVTGAATVLTGSLVNVTAASVEGVSVVISG